ncbi:hypothetical protein ACHAXH_006012, partial [Discostella pseudostelligera]
EHIIVASSKLDGDGGIKEKNKRINEALKGSSHGGTLILADTKAQVNKACLGKCCLSLAALFCVVTLH